MDGRVLWYQPGTHEGCLVSDSGRHFPFRTRGEDGSIHDGAHVVFKVSERDGDLVGVKVRATGSCTEALRHENEKLAREIRSLAAIER